MQNHEKYELTNPQKNIWYTEQYFKGTSINNICGSVYIKQKIDIKLLSIAINKFIENNDSFKLRFKLIDGNLKQYFSKNTKYIFDIISINNLSQVDKYGEEIAKKPFNIIDSKLFDFKIFVLPDGNGGFIISAHHIISDAATFAIAVKEIISNYSLLLKKQNILKKDYSYKDYIKSEKEYLKSTRFEKDKLFWNEFLSNIPEPATIPSFKKEIDLPNANRLEYKFDKDLFKKIDNYCKTNKLSIYNFLIAIYSIYFGKINNMNEFTIGTPILNRSSFAEKNTSGMYISTSLLKINICDKLSFIEFAKQIAKDCMSMLRHQKYNYQYILENIRNKDKNVSNLYDILLSYQITKANDANLDIPYDIKWYLTPYISNSLDIHFHDNNDENNLLIEYDYKISKYDENDILNMHNRIVWIIKQVLKNDNINIDTIDIKTPEECLVLNKFNNTDHKFNYSENILLEIEKIAKSNENKIALQYENTTITYKNLIERINQLSNMLISKYHFTEGNNIGISTNRTIDTIIGILAIVKINCTYVPIDPTYPKNRINHMVETSNLSYILTDNIKEDTTIFSNLEILDICYKQYKDEPKTLKYKFNYNKNSNLYIIFTSGTTGKPKGVTISHKNIMNLIFFEKYKTNIFKKSNKILQFATMSFDVSYQEIYSALLTGNTLVLIDDLTRKDITKLSNYILNQKITTLFIPPAYLRLLTENEDAINKFSKSVKNIICAGEQLVITNGIKKLISNGICLYNHYGPAETHVATTYKVSDTDLLNPPIGYPISNSQVVILDKNNKLLPIGVVGQIAISGDCVGNGYFNNKKLSDEKFITINNQKTYLTGDLGYFDYNGCIHYIGRSDFQVKINGFRIELDEIDNTISSNSDIDSVKSIIMEENNKKHIITYYTSKKVTEPELSKYIREKLPYYMFPSKIIKLEKMPLNINGKIDKSKLPNISLTDSNIEFIDASSDTEKQLQKIWEKIFNSKKIGVNYNFFDIGGDSLTAINLCLEINNEFNTDINVQDIFSNPTIREIAELLNNKKVSLSDKIGKVQIADFYPCSSAQKRIYYSSIIGNNKMAYNMPGALILSKMPDIKKLENCLKEIISRHESLRTSFDIINGELVQKISEKINFKIDYDENIITDKKIALDNFVKPFNLSKAPLLRVKLSKLENNKAILLFDIHHIISDGVSLNILIDEMCKLYNGDTLEPLQITYKDYSVWEKNQLENNKFKKSEKYWLEQFSDDIPILNLPTNYPRPIIQSFEGDNIYQKLDKTTVTKINNIAKKLNITPYMFLLACYYILLYKYTSNNELIVGTPVVGRDKKEINNVIGMFVNSLPIRTTINSDDTFISFANSVKKICLNSFEHQSYPFDELVNKLNLKKDSSRNPLFDTMFVYQNNGQTTAKLGNIKSTYYIPNANVSKFDLSLEITPENDTLNLRFEYATKLFTKDFIKYLSIHYMNILKSVIQKNDIKISEIEILTDSEKDKIINEFNDNKTDYPKNQSIVQLFEKQVKQNLSKTAVVFENQTLTYKELNEKANHLAHILQNNNVKPNDIVGILLPRSIDLIICIWGILKTGAGYMLIDSSLPTERIDFMLQNANSPLLITHKNFSKIKFNNMLYLDDINLGNEFLQNLNLTISNENNLAVIYTSGSTGTPKGVMLKQLGLLNLLTVYRTMLNTDICNNFLCCSAVSFDMFIVETFIPILSGKTIILANEDERKIPNYTSELISKNNVEFILTTPSRIDLLLNDNFSSCLKNVKIIQLGGEVLTPVLYDKLSKVTKANIFNGYGPTEITACCSSKLVTSSTDISIGKSVCNSKILIMDQDSNLCPINVPGELCVSGDGVSKGYINNKTATEKTFVETKYLDKIIYKTGDIAKYNENGELIYLGRNDSQIKIRGLRIELSEIESKLLATDKIEKCAVIYKKDDKNPHIVAFFTSKLELDIPNIRKKLAEVLPLYMIPKYIIQISQMPITTNGKVNTRELYHMKFDVMESNFVAPKTERQKLFCSILEKLLNVQVGITDDLFELGMDSLIAIKFKVELLNNNIDMPYASIFKYHTVKDLCDKDLNELEVTSINDYSFDSINKVLSKNVFKNNIEINKSNTNNVLLLGSTGYVGAHILKSFLENDKGNIYCIVRDKNNTLAKTRFIDTLHFYFGTKLDKYIDKRIFILKGNLLKENFDLSIANINLLKDNISVVINSAANVKHFGNVDKFNNINVGLINNLINFCKENNKRLIHLSSLSISGNMVLDGTAKKQIFNKNVSFTEKSLYINQALDNVYTRTKFEAERLILDNIYTGLNAQILRLGNITNRYTDGKFQINPSENAFLTRVISLANIGFVPQSIMSSYVEFTPVDSCADAIISIMQNYVKNYSVFHVYDYHHVNMDKLLELFEQNNMHFEVLNNNAFTALLLNLLKTPNKKQYVSGIINDLSDDKKLNYDANVNIKSDFTRQFLEKIGFTWPIIDENYIKKYVTYLRKNKFI